MNAYITTVFRRIALISFRIIIIFFLGVGVYLVFPRSSYAAFNQLVNGSLDLPFNFGGNPCVQVGWLPVAGSLLAAIDCEGPVSLSNGISLKTRNGAEVSQTVDVTPFTNYTIGVWVTTSPNGQGNLGVQVGAGPITWVSSINVTWTQLSINVNSGNNNQITIHFKTNNRGLPGVDDTYYDNASLSFANSSLCSSISPPGGGTVIPGRSYTASVQMQNTGVTTWTSGANYHLGSQDPQDNVTWGSNRASLSSEPVAPGAIGIFNFTVTVPTSAGGACPSIPGTCTFDWKMVQDGVEWFGQVCTSTVTVIDPFPIGYVVYPGGYSATCSTITGWACDRSRPDLFIQVDFWDFTSTPTPLGSTTANRQDLYPDPGVLSACESSVYHGYSFTIPGSIIDNTTHNIRAYGINIDSSGNPVGSGNSQLTSIPSNASNNVDVICSIPTPTTVPPTPTPIPTSTPVPTPTPTPIPVYTIVGNVCRDFNRNGVKDCGAGFPCDDNYTLGAAIVLSGSASKSTTTDGSGNYSFSSLLSGVYNLDLTTYDTANYDGVYPGSAPLSITSIALPPSTIYNFCVAPKIPAITSLVVNELTLGQSSPFSCPYGISGAQTSENGSNCFNPLRITLNATTYSVPGTDYAYYVGFYDQAGGPASIAGGSAGIVDIQGRINSNPKNGFLLRYHTSGNYYGWIGGTWTLLNSSGINTPSSGTPFLRLYSAPAGLPLSSWRVDLWKAFGSKPMFTAVQIFDSWGQFSPIIPNLSPIP